MKNERYLMALYLLTVADIRGTSPKVWNAWKAKLLETLFLKFIPRYIRAILKSEAKPVSNPTLVSVFKSR
jgi:UTP:GlnB (protein PII) uridylyltransferase